MKKSSGAGKMGRALIAKKKQSTHHPPTWGHQSKTARKAANPYTKDGDNEWSFGYEARQHLFVLRAVPLLREITYFQQNKRASEQLANSYSTAEKFFENMDVTDSVFAADPETGELCHKFSTIKHGEEVEACMRFVNGIGMTKKEWGNVFRPLGLPLQRGIIQDVVQAFDVVHYDDNPYRQQQMFFLNLPELEENTIEEHLNSEDEIAHLRTTFTARAYAIDDPSASEIDDAVSLTVEDGKEWIHIHAADVTRYLPWGGALNKLASKRIVTAYLPEKTFPMLPWEITKQASLDNKDGPRAALTFSARIDMEGQQGKILDYRVRATYLKDVKQITYAQTEKILQQHGFDASTTHTPLGIQSPFSEGEIELDPPEWCGDEDVSTLCRLKEYTAALSAWKTTHGAKKIQNLTSSVRVEGVDFEAPKETQAEIGWKIGMDTMFGGARSLVEHLMICAGSIAAQFAIKNHLVVPFRTDCADGVTRAHSGDWQKTLRNYPHSCYLRVGGQLAAAETISVDPSELTTEVIAQNMYKSVQALNSTDPAEYSLTPFPHRSVGLPAYLQVTSPIRRFSDTVAHYQIKKFLKTGAGYSRKNIQIQCTVLNRKAEAEEKIEKMSSLFWTLQRLKQQMLQTQQKLCYTGIVMDIFDLRGNIFSVNKPHTKQYHLVVCIVDLGLYRATTSDTLFSCGEVVECEVTSVDPRNAQLGFTVRRAAGGRKQLVSIM
eukprot:TRINITY_DN64571_c0_g1_i1.p1 TRINITY_DN64571_c0_g1~~TRINITY_DN64571_c0_g1_i1.p1  ORF type:complete len:729 (-),score=47.16 TRINITY_DN64571_c0_g1_i1:1055-3208(-)